MEISINGSKEIVAEQATLLSLVELQVGDKQKGIAVAVNNQVVPKAEWASTILRANDSVLIIKATQGG